jgi:hypothetical protein
MSVHLSALSRQNVSALLCSSAESYLCLQQSYIIHVSFISVYMWYSPSRLSQLPCFPVNTIKINLPGFSRSGLATTISLDGANLHDITEILFESSVKHHKTNQLLKSDWSWLYKVVYSVFCRFCIILFLVIL